MKLEHILVAIDFSEASERALDWAVGVAGPSAAQVEVIHVWEAPGYLEGPFTEVAQAEAGSRVREAYEAAGRLLHEALQRYDESNMLSPRLEVGTPWKVICDRAEARRHDLVVIGTHARKGAARALLGSVAEKVMRNAPCPVTVVR